MTEKPEFPVYCRAPSESLLKLLRKGGFLEPLTALHGEKKGSCELALDVHFRRHDEVHVYFGLTRLVTAKLKKNKEIKISAAKSHMSHDRKCFFRDWHIGEEGFQDGLNDYLDTVTGKVDRRWIAKEGQVQAIWAGVTMQDGPWTPFDREAVLDYSKFYNAKKEAEKFRNFPQIKDTYSLVGSIAQSWAKLPNPGTELDQIAIDEDWNLVLIELKFSGEGYSGDKIYYSPLQLLQYVHEWSCALRYSSVREGLQELIEKRHTVGLVPSKLPELSGGIRAAICFGADKCSLEVKRRFYEVLGVVNAHLPSNVPPVEVWCLDDKGPQLL